MNRNKGKGMTKNFFYGILYKIDTRIVAYMKIFLLKVKGYLEEFVMGYTVCIANLDSRQKEALQEKQSLDFVCIKGISGKQKAVWIIR